MLVNSTILYLFSSLSNLFLLSSYSLPWASHTLSPSPAPASSLFCLLTLTALPGDLFLLSLMSSW